MTDREEFKAELDRLKEETGIGLSEWENGVEHGRMEVINALYKKLDSMKKEPKKCMYSKNHYTDEDRKVFCDGCEEKCKYDKSDDFTKALAECIHNAQCNVVDPMVFAETWKDELIKLSKCEEPVSEDLEEAADEYAKDYLFTRKPQRAPNIHFINGANWQKQQLMAKAVDGLVVCNNLTHGFKDIVMEIPSFLNVDDKVKLIIIKGE